MNAGASGVRGGSHENILAPHEDVLGHVSEYDSLVDLLSQRIESVSATLHAFVAGMPYY